MILIADSGSTKCDWVLCDKDQSSPIRIKTKGLNPAILSKKEFIKIVEQTSELCKVKDQIKEIQFFGAGCGTRKNQKKVNTILESFFENAKCVSGEDTMAAIMATTNEPGVVCILGTGSNCCYFDGQHLHMKTPALGYMLMDEGSGNYFGKKLLKSYYYRRMPSDLRMLFEKTYDLKEKDVVKGLYRSETPNKYLASFTPFLFQHKTHLFMKQLLADGIDLFIENHILNYRETLKHVPVHFVGSIAFYAQDYIRQALEIRGIQVGIFVKSPMDNIIRQQLEIN